MSQCRGFNFGLLISSISPKLAGNSTLVPWFCNTKDLEGGTNSGGLDTGVDGLIAGDGTPHCFLCHGNGGGGGGAEPGISQCFLCGKGGGAGAGTGTVPISSKGGVSDMSEIFQCFLCVAAAPKEPVLNPLNVPLSVSGDDNRAGDKGTDDKPGNISPSETLDILGD